MGYPPLSSFVVGGTNAGPTPYQGSMQRNRQHFCGCAIISSTWILTAAHCLAVLVVEYFYDPRQFQLISVIEIWLKFHLDHQMALK